jgi:hypothetical protein
LLKFNGILTILVRISLLPIDINSKASPKDLRVLMKIMIDSLSHLTMKEISFAYCEMNSKD